MGAKAGRHAAARRVTYPAAHILLKTETAAQCVTRKERALAVAEVLERKAAAPCLAAYWHDVQTGLRRDIERVKGELLCNS